MGRLIDADALMLEQQSLEDVGQGIMEFYSKEQIDQAPIIEAIPKDQYEARLKADMVAMLKEILLEIEQCGVEDSHWIIKEKINALKEKEDE